MSKHKPQNLEFSKWLEELRRIAVTEYGYSEESAATFDAKAYRESYYEGGYSPSDAFAEDMSYA